MCVFVVCMCVFVVCVCECVWCMCECVVCVYVYICVNVSIVYVSV